MARRYTDFELVNGDLAITLTPEGQDFIAIAQADGMNIDSDQFMYYLFEWQCCNGWESIAPEELGALTDAPILCNCAERNEDGLLTLVSRAYWFPNYQVESAVHTLRVRGIVTFTGVSSEDTKSAARSDRFAKLSGYHTLPARA